MTAYAQARAAAVVHVQGSAHAPPQASVAGHEQESADVAWMMSVDVIKLASAGVGLERHQLPGGGDWTADAVVQRAVVVDYA